MHETLTAIPSFHVYNNGINNRLVFKIKDRYKLDLQASETMKLFGSTKKLIDETKNEENFRPWSSWSSFSQCNLVDNQYQQKSEVLYTFTPNKSYAFLLI